MVRSNVCSVTTVSVILITEERSEWLIKFHVVNYYFVPKLHEAPTYFQVPDITDLEIEPFPLNHLVREINGVLVLVQTCAPNCINSTPCARGRGDHVILPFTTRVAMLSAVSRAAAGVLRGVKPSLTPQKFQNEGTKIILSLSVNSEYINLTNRYAFLLLKFRFTLSGPWYVATFVFVY